MSLPAQRMSAAPPKARSNGVIDLFSGAGGMSLGASRAGFVVSAAVELDPQAIASHKRNFPNAIHVQEDVRGLSGKCLRSLLALSNGDLAGVIGGPPCEGFSYIGANDQHDPRNELFKEFFRIVAELLPKFFLAENVPGILDERHSRTRDEAFSLVQGTYVILEPIIASASKYGAPTRRRRVFFFGYRSDEMHPLTLQDFEPPGDVEDVRVRDALRGMPKVKPEWQKEEQGWRVVRTYGQGFFVKRLQGRIPPGVGDPTAIRRLREESRASGCLGTVHSGKVARRYARMEPGTRDSVSKAHRLDLDGFCPTLRAGTGPERGRFQAVRPVHPTEARVITPREAARLQGFPDWFVFAPSKWHSFRQIGSSVSPIVAERLLMAIRKAISDGG